MWNKLASAGQSYLVVGIVVELELVNEESPHAHWYLATFVFDMRQRNGDCLLDQIAHPIREIVGTRHGRIGKAEELLEGSLKMVLTHPIQTGGSALGETFRC